MSDIGSDLDAAVEMVHEAEDALRKKEPDHDLIAYLSIRDEEVREAAWQAQLKRFSREPDADGNVKGAMATTYALAKYLIALQGALDGRPAPECICPRECDCLDPSPALGSTRWVSHECPEHNENPRPNHDCRAKVHWDNRGQNR